MPVASGESRRTPDQAHPDAPPNSREEVSRKPRILVVEDEYLTAMYAEQALLDAGFQVIGPAASADKAVSLACAEEPDLVVMDIRLLGERDGIDAAKDIFERIGIRCVFATAYSTPDIRRRAQSTAPLGWLPKPYTPVALVHTVRSALAAARTEAR